MPFRHPDRSADLTARIEAEVRERLEEAIDFVCLEALVQARRRRGLPAPAADNPADRRDFERTVHAFLELLHAEFGTPTAAGADRVSGRLLEVQVTLARRVPEYWQRFERVGSRYLAEAPGSGGEGRGLLGRLFSRR